MVKVLDFEPNEEKEKIAEVIENTAMALEAALEQYFSTNANLAVGSQFAENDLIANAFRTYKSHKEMEAKKEQMRKVRSAMAIDHSPDMWSANQTYFVKYDSLKVRGDPSENGIYTVTGRYNTGTSSIDYFKFHDARMFLKEPTSVALPNCCKKSSDMSPELSFEYGEEIYIFGEVDDIGFYVGERKNGEKGLIDQRHLLLEAVYNGGWEKKDYVGAPNCNFITEKFINDKEAMEQKKEKRRQVERHNSEVSILLGKINDTIKRIEKEAEEEEQEPQTRKEIFKGLLGVEPYWHSDAESLRSICFKSSSEESDSGESFEVVDEHDQHEKQNAEILKRFSLEDCELETSHTVPNVEMDFNDKGGIVISTENMSSWKLMQLYEAVEKAVDKKMAEWNMEKAEVQEEDEEESDSEVDDDSDDSEEESEEDSDVDENAEEKKKIGEDSPKPRLFFSDDSDEDSDDSEEDSDDSEEDSDDSEEDSSDVHEDTEEKKKVGEDSPKPRLFFSDDSVDSEEDSDDSDEYSDDSEEDSDVDEDAEEKKKCEEHTQKPELFLFDDAYFLKRSNDYFAYIERITAIEQEIRRKCMPSEKYDEDSDEDEESDLEVVEKEDEKDEEEAVDSGDDSDDQEEEQKSVILLIESEDDEEDQKSDIVVVVDHGSVDEAEKQKKAEQQTKAQKFIDQYRFKKNMEILKGHVENMKSMTDMRTKMEMTQHVKEFMTSGWFNK